MAEGRRRSRQLDGQATVISCKVFRKLSCNTDKRNILSADKSVTNPVSCQLSCYATPGCAAFTFNQGNPTSSRACILVKDCNTKTVECSSCISGPIMPRVNECLAAKQIEPTTPRTTTPSTSRSLIPAPGKPCANGCASFCVGPKCAEFAATVLNAATSGTSTNSMNDVTFAPSVATIPVREGTDPTTKLNFDSSKSVNELTTPTNTAVQGEATETTYTKAEEQTDPAYTDYDNQVTIDEDIFDDTFAYDDDENIDSYDEDYEYANYDDQVDYTQIKEDAPEDVEENDDMIDDKAMEEEDEEELDVAVNIDPGFLNKGISNSSSLAPDTEFVEPRSTNSASGNQPTFFFFFCALGGENSEGAVSAVDIIRESLNYVASAFKIASMPSQVTRGEGASAAYTGESITSCSKGYSTLSPYGFVYNSGSCYDYNLNSAGWKQTGAKLTTYRKGGTMTKLGRYLMATGGYKGKKAVRSIEVFDPKRPKKGWKKISKIRIPVSVSEHCTVSMKDKNGRQEIYLTGGKNRENMALKLDVKLNKWYSLNQMREGRKGHACIKSTINGRPGIVVSGGMDKMGRNLTSVEFYDASVGAWYSLPNLRSGRGNHAMVVNKGKIMVAGGEVIGGSGKEYLDSIEIFNGERWVRSRMKLNRPRSKFSLIKIPRQGRRVYTSSNRRRPSRKRNIQRGIGKGTSIRRRFPKQLY